VLISDTRIANALRQLVSNPLAFCPGRRHPLDKLSHINGKIMVTVLRKKTGYGTPNVLDLAPYFHKRAFSGIGAAVDVSILWTILQHLDKPPIPHRLDATG
jgi:hypothetical protein